jgi:hypothetical protein
MSTYTIYFHASVNIYSICQHICQHRLYMSTHLSTYTIYVNSSVNIDYIYVNTSVNIVREVKGGCLWYTFSTNVKCCFPSKCYCESQFLDFNGGSPLFHISQNKVANYPRFIRFCVKERSCFPHVILSHPHHWIWILWWRWKVLTEMLTTKQSINQIGI